MKHIVEQICNEEHRDENSADDYADSTDSSGRSVRWTRHIVRHERRVKPDEETHLLAELDYEKEPTVFRAAGAGY
jgi:hypothetical protein